MEFHALAGAEDVDRLGREILGAVGARQDQRAAAIRHQAAFQDAHGVGDHAAVEHVLDRDRVAEHGARVLARPFALHDGHRRQILVRHAVGLHVAQHGDGEERRRAERAVGHLELPGEALRLRRARRAGDAGLAAFAMGDEHGGAVARVYRGGGVADMEHERAAAHAGAVHPFRRDAEVVRHLLRHHRADAGQSVDVRWLELRVRHGVERRVGVQANLRQLRDQSELRGFRRADHGDLSGLDHDAPPLAGRKSGKVISSSSGSNATCTGMSSTRASGVCSQSMMLVIMRGPSSSSTTAMA